MPTRRCRAWTGNFHPFRPVTGEGVFQVPVGPVHAGIIEPGHFRFGVAGEPVLYLQLRLFYVHKGTEKRFERLPWPHTLFLAESISGDTAVGHALAYSHAIERLGRRRGAARARRYCAWSCSNSSACTTTSPTSARSRLTSPSPCRRAARRRSAKVWSGCTSVCSARDCSAGTIAFGGVKHDLTPDGARRAAPPSAHARDGSSTA